MHLATSLVAAALALPCARPRPVLVLPAPSATLRSSATALELGSAVAHADGGGAKPLEADEDQAKSQSKNAQSKVPPSPKAMSKDEQRVEIPTEDELLLVGSLYRPKASKEPSPAALLVHDAGASRADLTEIAERLQKQGFVVLAFDLRGQGESATPELDWSQLDPSSRERTWLASLRDMKAAAEFLRGQPSVHKASLSILGYRAGCTLAARHAVRDESVRSLVLLDPQPEQYGFSLMRDVEQLGGLPTYVAVTKESQSNAHRLVESGQRANNGSEFIQVAVFKGVAASPVEDKRMPADVARWMFEKAVPKKGER